MNEEKTIDGILYFRTMPSGKWKRGPLTACERKTKLILKRKDQLLSEALEQLLACEWSVSQAIIADIQKELGIEEG